MSQPGFDSPAVVWTGRFLGGLFVLAAFSQFKLHTFERTGTLKLAEATSRFKVTRTAHAKRGSILSSDGKALAADDDAYELNVEFTKVPKSEAFFMALGAATSIPAAEFMSLASQGHRNRTWRQTMAPAQFEAVRKVRRDWRADGVSIARTDRRIYPLGAAAGGLLGVVREGKPLFGIESSKNEILAGVDGVRKGMTDRRGAFLPTRMDTSIEREPRDGKSITLTLDSELQEAASDAIREAVETHKADNGVAMVLDPKTGDLLAMANWPSFAPYAPDGSVTKLENHLVFNPAFMAQLEPGSTFKCLTLAKAFDEGVWGENQSLNCTGILHPTARTRIQCDKHGGSRAHGVVDPEVAIAKSCNVAASTWALKVGREDFMQFVRDLGILSKSKLGLPGEGHGNFNYDEPAKILQLATVGFGQSLTCTPVGLLGAFGLLANDGVRMEPRLVKAIGTAEIPVEEGRRVVGPEAARAVLKTMEAVIESDAGTGKSLRIPGYRLGGKTGTAQKIGKGQTGHVSNFVGFVPSMDPKAVILIMVNNPKGGAYYGATVAGPPFKAVAEAVIKRYEIAPTEPIMAKKDKVPPVH